MVKFHCIAHDHNKSMKSIPAELDRRREEWGGYI